MEKQQQPPPSQQQESIGLGQYLRNALQQGLQLLKNPVKLLPTIAISLVWLIIGILSSLWKPFPWPMQFLSFLSYAEGGLFGGFFGAVGGIVGKVVMAVFINSLVLPLFEKKPPFVGVKGGLKGMVDSIKNDTAKGLSPLLTGVGLSLLLYTLMNINQRWQNSMVGIVSLVMLLQTIGNKGSFFMGLIFSAARSLTKGKVPPLIDVTRFLSGMTIGFAIAVGLSLVGLHLCFWLGGFFLFWGVVLTVLMRGTSKTSTLQSSSTGVGSATSTPPPPPPSSTPPPPPPSSPANLPPPPPPPFPPRYC